MHSRYQIPANFYELLPELKEKTFKWRLEYSSRSENATIGYITHYSPIMDNGKKPNGNIILAPGLASNADIEPLMKAITYWALTKKFNVYSITTFLGDFKPEVTPALAARNTFPEFIKLMDMGIDLIEEQCRDQWTCLIGHSAGATGAIEIFNKRIKENKTPRVSAAILFAPWCTTQWHDFIKSVYKVRHCPPNITDEEFMSLLEEYKNEEEVKTIFGDEDSGFGDYLIYIIIAVVLILISGVVIVIIKKKRSSDL